MIVWLNDNLIDAAEARISPFDRGFIFGDSLYEGLRAVRTAPRGSSSPNPRVVALGAHIERLRAGLAETRIPWDPSSLGDMTLRLLAANSLADAFVYWQVSRGTPPLDASHPNPRTRVPAPATRPTVFGFCTPLPSLDEYSTPAPKHAIVTPDIRWALGHVKSCSLMGNVITCLRAEEARCDDAVLLRDSLVTEGTATNIVLALDPPPPHAHAPGAAAAGFELVTPSLASAPMLPGVTRAILLDAMPEIVTRPVRADELRRAREIMLVGTGTMLCSIVSLDGVPVGAGRPGPIAARALHALTDAIRSGRDQHVRLESRRASPEPHDPRRQGFPPCGTSQA